MPDPVIPIDALLTELGFERVASKQAARNVLIAAELTNQRKRNMAAGKRDAAVAVIRQRIARVCDRPACQETLATDGRQRIVVASTACEVCGGSDIARTVQQMAADLVAAQRTRLLVLGGSPGTQRELRDRLAATPVEVRFVDMKPTGAKRARALAGWADVIVVWASTPLPHKTSQPFVGLAPERTFTVRRRSVAALAEEVSRHLSGTAGGRR